MTTHDTTSDTTSDTTQDTTLLAALAPLLPELDSTAVARDERGGTPKHERDLLRRSGLLRATIPVELGGDGASWPALALAVRQLARVDSSLAHVFGFHHLLLATVQLFGTSDQYAKLARDTVEQRWFWGNALNPRDTRTRATRAADGLRFTGTKSFCSGALDADALVLSALDEGGKLVVAALPSTRAGIVRHGDWDAIGQRQTDSGTVELLDVHVRDDEVLRSPGPLGSVRASLRPCIAQLVLVNVYQGIGEGALAAAAAWLRGRSSSSVDPFVLRHGGEMAVGLAGATALADVAAAALERAWRAGEALDVAGRAACARAIALAKVATTKASLDVTSRLFDVTGARGATVPGLDRFWRNARTHTLHDPVDHKLRELGAWALLGEATPPSFYS